MSIKSTIMCPLSSIADPAYAVCVLRCVPPTPPPPDRAYSFTYKVPNLYPKQNQSGVGFLYIIQILCCARINIVNEHFVVHGVNYLHICTCRVRFVHLNE